MYNLFFIIPLLIIYFILRHYAVRSVDISIYFTNCLYYIKTIFTGIMLYIEKIIYPSSMPIMLYEFKPTWQTYIINFLVFIPLFFIYLKNIIDRKIIIFAILFSLLAILPAFAQEEYVFFTHRLIISLTGIIILIAAIIEEIITKYQKAKKYFFMTFIFLFSLFSFCSFTNINQYKDNFTYWNNAYINAPNYYAIYLQLAKEYATKKMYNEAIAFSLKSIELRKCFDNCLTYATILFQNKDYVLSKDLFFQLLEIDENNFLIYQYLSNIFLFETNYEKAIEFAKKAITNTQNQTIDEKIAILENLARVYSIVGNFQEAINILFELLNYDKNNPRYYKLLSMLYDDLNDYNNSIIYINKALEFEPNNEEYINQLKNVEAKISAKD